jgi:mono/diheme cytochrome c family protein
MRGVRLGTLILLPAWLGLSLAWSAAAAEPVDYGKDVKAVLKSRCFACHGALKQEAMLRLDTVAAMQKGGESGPVIKAGDLAGSLLISRITHADAAERMPPEGEPPLKAEQIAAIKAWIEQGARGIPGEQPEADPREHWAFKKPVKTPLVIPPGNISGSPIDILISEQHQQHGLTPLGPAEKHVILRRATLDLTGLPPTREELHTFLADASPDAYERVVDRLLASPSYGERWGRHWMDVWRYSDWYGRRSVPDVMNSYPQIWRWRDWIVRSLNEDKGYDRMVTQMLAADEVCPGEEENLAATGFVVRNWFKWNYDQWMRDQTEHTAKALLGLTLNCALCHDHKYDPISQEEYFRFRAHFEPLELRHDRVAGDADPGNFKKYIYAQSYGPIASGRIRIFDEKLDALTAMYRGGDQRNKFDKPPVPPGILSILGSDGYDVKPVDLPAEAYYPGLRPFVQREEMAKVQEAVGVAMAELEAAKKSLQTLVSSFVMSVTKAEAALAEAKAKSGTSESPEIRAKVQELAAAELLVTLAEKKMAAVQAEVMSMEARVKADRARYGMEPGNADELAVVAAKAERQAKLLQAQANQAVAEMAVAQASAKPVTDMKRAAEVQAAQAKVTAAVTALTAAEAEAKKTDGNYSPLSAVFPRQSTGRRTALAKWITSRDNPLTARVAINHIWQRHFGRGIVETSANFGRNGKLPTNQPLIDSLAVELMDGGWNMKRLHRRIVASDAYRRASSAGGYAENAAKDAENIHLWRFTPGRMEAEEVRDSVLYLAGELDAKMGGKEIEQTEALASHRRSIYLSHHGEARMEFLDLFDVAVPTDCYQRTSSIRPQQALALANSELTLVQSRLLAARLWKNVGEASEAEREPKFIAAAFEQVLSRPPTEPESAASQRFLAAQRELIKGSSDAGNKSRESLVHALLNHNDFVTIR